MQWLYHTGRQDETDVDKADTPSCLRVRVNASYIDTWHVAGANRPDHAAS